MLFFEGTNAINAFRAQQLFSNLKKIAPDIAAVTAEYRYFIDAPRFSDADRKKLEHLLVADYKDFERITSKLMATDEQLFVWVVQRLGTISPWSSKATRQRRSVVP